MAFLDDLLLLYGVFGILHQKDLTIRKKGSTINNERNVNDIAKPQSGKANECGRGARNATESEKRK